MSSKTCARFGHEFDANLKYCPACRERERRTLALAATVGIALIVSVLISIFGYFFGAHSAESSEPKAERYKATLFIQFQNEEDKRVGAVTACQTFITKHLKNPDSATFLDPVTSTPIDALADDIYVVRARIRAKNSFGSFGISSFSCEVAPYDDHWTLRRLKEIKL